MKKKNTGNERFKILRAFVHVFLALAGLSGLAYMLLLWLAYESHFYNEYEIAEACEVLNIRSTDFCNLDNRVKSEDLEEALEIVYPPVETDYIGIFNNVEQRIVFNSGDCIALNRANLCPEPDHCSSDYSCYTSFEGIRVYFHFSSEGQLLGFSAQDPGS